MRQLDIPVPIELTRIEATQLISATVATLPATEKQLEALRRLGVDFDASIPRPEASQLLEDAFQVSNFANLVCANEFTIQRGPDGRFVKGNLAGVTDALLSAHIARS